MISMEIKITALLVISTETTTTAPLVNYLPATKQSIAGNLIKTEPTL